jgi:hypothetical protein
MRRRTRISMSLGTAALVLTVLFATVLFVIDGPRTPWPATLGPPPASGAAPSNPPADGRPWSAVAWRQLEGAIPLGPDPGHDRFDGLLAAPGGLVAWGRTSTPGRNQFNDLAAIFLSSTGDVWEIVPIVSGVAPPDTSEVYHVAVGPTGFLVFGGVCCEFEERPALWISSDARQWDRVPYPESLIGSSLVDVTSTGDRWIAAGTSGDGHTALWTSPDGIEWTHVDDPGADLGSGGFNDIVATDDGLIVAGWRDMGPTYDGAMWRSADGIAWMPVALDPVFSGALDTVLNRMVPFADDSWWAYGSEGPPEDRVACERALGRVASIDADGVPPEDRPAFTCGWGLDTFWVSDDGTAWERLPVRAFGVPAPRGELIEFRFVAAGGPGLVAMGEGSGDSHPSLFVSADGRGWRRLPAQPPFTIGQSLSGFAALGRRLVVVGEDWNPNNGQAARPAIWIGEVR